MHGTLRSLLEDGFIVFKSVLSESEVVQGASYIDSKQQTVDYANIEKFIRSTMLATVQKQLGSQQPLDFVKFRVSDNNNSADASGFHRDIMYKGSEMRTIFVPCFTCLTYFDRTVMELIPRSHLTNYALIETPQLYAKKVRLEIAPGDILLFFSSLLHRGIFSNSGSHRRVIQVFEVFTSSRIMKAITPLIIHVPGDEKYSDWMVKASKSDNLLVQIINFYGFLNAATGYGNRNICGMDGKYAYISSEGLRGRLKVIPGTWQPINKYILNERVPVTDMPHGCIALYKYYAFNRQFIIYTCIVVVNIVFVAAIVVPPKPST